MDNIVSRFFGLRKMRLTYFKFGCNKLNVSYKQKTIMHVIYLVRKKLFSYEKYSEQK